MYLTFIMKEIFLIGKYGSVIGNYALVDDEDFEYLNQWKWHANKRRSAFYAARNIWIKEIRRAKVVHMHREIMNLTDISIQADHIDHNGLNNQRANLRPCTPRQNAMNMRKGVGVSKYKGVRPHRYKDKMWTAAIRLNGKHMIIGVYEHEADAALAYNDAAMIHYGQFACLNKIE